MRVTFPRIRARLQQRFAWMKDSVRKSFTNDLNVSSILQVCCYTEAMARFWAGTVVEVPRDGARIFTDFMRRYFTDFGEAAVPLGKFYINKDRGTRAGKPSLVDAFEAFYCLYRHGLVHEYLQKANSFITRTRDAGSRPYLKVTANRRGVRDPRGNKTKRLHVHLDPLLEDFCNATDAYWADLIARRGSRCLRANAAARYRFILR